MTLELLPQGITPSGHGATMKMKQPRLGLVARSSWQQSANRFYRRDSELQKERMERYQGQWMRCTDG